jgi:tellurite resistance protein TerC
MSYRNALLWSGFWILSALCFACGIGYYQGIDNAYTFLTGYIVEKMLSFDNLFMFYIIFEYMRLSSADQRRVLNWGIIGAIILRGAFILSGCFLVGQYQWLLYLFAAFLVYSGIKIFFSNDDDNESPEIVDRIQKWFPSYGILLTSIIVIEITDILFALDSLPAILSITQNQFLVLSSNLFAILGLRSLYFVMLGLIKKLTMLPYCVGIILTFIGAKMLVRPWYEISTIISLSFILSCIITGILISKWGKS